ERTFDRDRIGRVDHYWNLYYSNQAFVKAVYVIQLVAVGILKVYVANLRATLHLLPCDLSGFFVFLFGNQPLEFAGANLISAFAHDQRPLVVTCFDKVDSGKERTMMCPWNPRTLSFNHLRQRANVAVVSSATTSHQVQPSVIHKTLDSACECLGSFEVDTVLIRKARVGHARDQRLRELRQGANVIGHELRSGSAIQTNRQQIRMHDRCRVRLDRLAAEHRVAYLLDGARYHHWDLEPDLLEDSPDPDQRSLDVAGVLLRFDQQDIHTALYQSRCLVVKRFDQLIKSYSARHRNGFSSGPNRARNEPGLSEGRVLRSGLPGQFCGARVDLPHLVLQTVLGEDDRSSTESGGLYDVRACVKITAMDIEDDVGPGEYEVFVAAFQVRSAKISGGQLLCLNSGAHRAVQNEDSFLKHRLQQPYPVIVF